MTKAEEVIELMETEYLARNEACRKLGVPTSTFNDQMKREGLTDRYARAREGRADKLFEDLLDISNEVQGVIIDEDGNKRLDSGWQQRQKLRIDTLKFAIAKMNPNKYGDRIEQVITTSKSWPSWMTESDE